MAIEIGAIVIIDGKRWKVADIWPVGQAQLYRRDNGKDRIKYLPVEQLNGDRVNDRSD